MITLEDNYHVELLRKAALADEYYRMTQSPETWREWTCSDRAAWIRKYENKPRWEVQGAYDYATGLNWYQVALDVVGRPRNVTAKFATKASAEDYARDLNKAAIDASCRSSRS